MTSNERQKKIIRLLDKRRKDTMEHLSIEFHVSTDTISRDIATLNEDYPIKIVRGRNGGLSLPDGYHLFKKMYMTPVQALALQAGDLEYPRQKANRLAVREPHRVRNEILRQFAVHPGRRIAPRHFESDTGFGGKLHR